MTATDETVVAVVAPPDPLEEAEARALATLAGLEFADLTEFPVDRGLAAALACVIPEPDARANSVTAVGWRDGAPLVAISAPENVLTLDDLSRSIGREIVPIVASASQVAEFLKLVYRTQAEPEDRAGPTGTHEEPGRATAAQEGATDSALAGPGSPHVDHGLVSARGAADVTVRDGTAGPQGTRPPAEPQAAAGAGPLTPTAQQPEPAAHKSLIAPRAGSAADSKAAAGAAGIEYVELGAFAVDATAKSVLSEHFARQRGVAALGWLDDVPIVAISAPADFQLLEDVRAAAGRDVRFIAAAAEDIAAYNDRLYQPATPAAAAAPAAGQAPADGPAPPTAGDRPAPSPAAMSATPSAPAGTAEPRTTTPPVTSLRDLPPPTGRPATPERQVVTMESVLVRSGLLSADQLPKLLEERNRTGRSLREIIADRRLVPEADLYRAVAEEAGLEFVDLNDWDIDQRAAERVPEALARRHQLLSIGFTDLGEPIVAMANPSDVIALDDIRTLLGRDIETVVCPPSQIADYLPRLYRQTRQADLMARNAALAAAPTESTSRNVLTIVEDGPIVQFVNLILRQALSQRASDVHIEPTADDVQVRFRIDGVMHPITSTPKSIQSGVLTRLKVMADLDIAEHRIPQDGRISLNFGNREIDLRVATLPTVHGEMVALRILDKESATLELSKLGFDPQVLTAYESAFRKPYGTILVTGPTGSGKSTTLYATLNRLNLPDRKLITVEDPVEYQLRGINQVQVNPKAGLGFANALRSILRSDPDVILVGEIRDRETAVIAIEAALTGHLVLSSLHTNDAAGTPMRLVEMGLEAFLVGSALDCVVGQRLARVLCENCTEEYEPTDQELEAAGWDGRDAPDGEPARFRKAVGCQACSRTGYRGRMALHEVMLLSEEIERAVVTHAQSVEIQRIAEEQGMRTLRRDGLRKAARGVTSLEEILRVVA
jgi:type IV pilus assembly protein PilB